MLKRNHVPYKLVLYNKVQQKMIGSSTCKRSYFPQLYINGAYIFSKFIVLLIFIGEVVFFKEIYIKLEIIKVTFIC